MALNEVKSAIDNYLASGVGSLILPTDEIIELYVDNVGGFKKIKEDAEKIAEENGDVITKPEVDEIIDEERQKYIDELKKPGGQLKKEFDNKVNELKAGVAEIKTTAGELGKELGKAIADAATPTSAAIPNPISSALRLYLNVSKIKRAVDAILMLTSGVLGKISELGLENTPLAESVTSIVQPLIRIKADAEAEATKSDAVTEADATDELKKGYTAIRPTDGYFINGLEIEFETNESFPLSNNRIDELKEIQYLQAISEEEIRTQQWADVILSYNAWYIQNIV